MLTLAGQSHRLCDGVSRRSFLKIGGLAFGATTVLNLPQILQASHGRQSSHKAIINIFLAGGPPHQDLWDLKPDAPAEIRGEFSPIRTNVPGIEISEVFPRLARKMDKCALIRSITGSDGAHDGYQCLSGWRRNDNSSVGGRPSIGAVVSKLRGPIDRSVPPFVALAERAQHTPWSEPGAVGFLGSACQPFKPQGQGMDDLRLNGVSLDRLNDRRQLLQGLDQLRRDVDASGMLAGMDSFSEAAFGVLTSSKLVDALDLSKEDPQVVARYGDGKPYRYQFDGVPTCNEQLLMARRLIQAGVRCVTLSYGRWDSHFQNFDLVRDHGSKLDQALSALIEDLEVHGMLDDVTVIAWGEFGRSPRINEQAGRDHWPQVNAALLAGGGMRTGQVIGSTNRLGEYAKDRPVPFQEVIATLYHNLGINTMNTHITDPSGRPMFLVDHRDPIPELI